MFNKTFADRQAFNRALSQAYAALQQGDKREARHWAQVAASMDPGSEEPWLILGAASQARASIGYLKRALEINPQSERARGGLEWATRRLGEDSKSTKGKEAAAASKVKTPGSSVQVGQKKKTAAQGTRKHASASRIFIPIMILGLAMLLIAAWTFRPGKGAPVSVTSSTPTPSQDSTLLSEAPADPTLQPTELLPTETNPPISSPSPTAFQPVAATATPISTATPLIVTTVPVLNGLQEGEFLAAQFPTDGEKLITVSIQDQRLTATQGDTVVANFIVSTGRGRNTRTGTFHILDKLPNPYSYIWDFWMPNWMGIYYAGTLENGFHSLPVLKNGETIWGDALGTPISYGCVVLGETEAQALYNWAEVGTTVQINP